MLIQRQMVEPQSRARLSEEDNCIFMEYSFEGFLSDSLDLIEKLDKSETRRKLTKEWHGIDGEFKDVKKAWREGWEDGEKLVSALRNKMPLDLYDKVIPPMDYTKEWVYSEADGILDVQRSLEGEACCFGKEQQTTEINAGNRLITLVQSYGHNSFVDPQFMAYQGLLVYGLVEHLETLGYSTQVIAAFKTRVPLESVDKFVQIEVSLKEFGDYFDRHKMQLALVAPFMLRVNSLGVLQLVPNEDLRAAYFYEGGTFGSAASLTKKGGLTFEKNNPENFKEIEDNFRKVIQEFENLSLGA